MLGREQCENVLEQALTFSPAEHTEAIILGQESSLTRFADNTIHQNVSERSATLRVRAITGNRTGVVSGNDLSPAGIAETVRQAAAIAQLQPADPDFPGLPGPQEYPEIEGWFESTARCSPDRRARMVGSVCMQAESKGLTAAGALETASEEIAVANSNGLFAYHPYTTAQFVIVVMSADSSGYGSALAGDVDSLDIEAVARRALDKAIMGRRPRPLPPGRYDVVLEPAAAADILGIMGYTSFGAAEVEEGCSFLTGHFGEPVLDEKVTIVDDALNPHAIPMPFDYEGVAKKRVSVIVSGVAAGALHNTYTAAKSGVESTGHALLGPKPHPTRLALAPGTTSLEKMIAATDEGLLVTRFHYTRVVHQLRVTTTGMTRDGTFLIRNGEIAYPVKNLRFTQSYVEALKRPCFIGDKVELCPEYGACLVPAISIPGFNFTGATEF